MEKTQSTSSGSIGIFSLLGVLFVGLKLTGHIDWSWWWVTAPFWGPVAIFLAVIIPILIFGFVVSKLA